MQMSPGFAPRRWKLRMLLVVIPAVMLFASATTAPLAAAPLSNQRDPVSSAIVIGQDMGDATQTPEPDANPDREARRAAREATRAAEETTPEAAPSAATPAPEPADGPEALDDLDCTDFENQEAAQAVLDQDPADPYNLDPNQDGIACSLLPSASPDGAVVDPEVADAPVEQAQADSGNNQGNNQGNNRQNRQNQRQNQEPAVTCADFATQEEAQAAYIADLSDPNGLDPDLDGIACETNEDVAANDGGGGNGGNRQNRQNQQADANANADGAPGNNNNRRQNQQEQTLPEDLDCVDFDTREAAQAVFDADPTDPFNLDPNDDGFACTSLPSTSPLVSAVPRTGSGPDVFPLALLGLAVAGLAGLAALGITRRRIVN